MVACGPDIVDIENSFPEELMLDTKEPVVNVGRGQIGVYGLDCGAGAANPITAIQAELQSRIHRIA